MTHPARDGIARVGALLCWTASVLLMTSAERLMAKDAIMIVRGRIWTGNTEQPWAEAIALDHDRILAVGNRAEIDSLADASTKIYEAGQGLVAPGCIDAHIHFLSGGANLTSVQLRDAATKEEFTRRIAKFAERQPAGTWITGGDWDHTLWGGALPDRRWIDQQTGLHPVWIQRLDGHMALANTAAMRAAGLTDEISDVDGGEIARDDAGRPTGIFKDNAMSLIERFVPDPTLEQKLAAIEAAVDYVAARGVTCVHHMGDWDDVEALRIAQERGLLKVRLYACTPLAQWQKLADEISTRGPGNDWLRIGGLKGFVDGSLGSHTAAFLEPYSDAPDSRGLLVNTREDLYNWTSEADKAGLQVVVHAIGDRAIRMQLDIYDQVVAENGPRDRRFRIEHAQHIDPTDIPRFAQLEVIASMQPYHAIDDGRWADPVIGPERAVTTYAFRSLLDSGARLAFGSDWFVAPPTPLKGIYAAVTRRTLDDKHPNGWIPEQKINVEEALRAYTIDAAYAGFMENDVGSLEPGKLADLVILDRDITQIPQAEIRDTQVVLTVVGGRIVYRRPESAE